MESHFSTRGTYAMALTGLDKLLAEVRACTICAAHLPNPPRPVLRAARGGMG